MNTAQSNSTTKDLHNRMADLDDDVPRPWRGGSPESLKHSKALKTSAKPPVNVRWSVVQMNVYSGICNHVFHTKNVKKGWTTPSSTSKQNNKEPTA